MKISSGRKQEKKKTGLYLSVQSIYSLFYSFTSYLSSPTLCQILWEGVELNPSPCFEGKEVMVYTDGPLFSTHYVPATVLSTSDPNPIGSSPQPSEVENLPFSDEENKTLR